MDVIARYPEFSPLSLEAVQAIKTDLQLLKDGMSELTFGSLYFFRNFYKYKISRFNERTLLFLGEERKKPFFFSSVGIDQIISRKRSVAFILPCEKKIFSGNIKYSVVYFFKINCGRKIP